MFKIQDIVFKLKNKFKMFYGISVGWVNVTKVIKYETKNVQ